MAYSGADSKGRRQLCEKTIGDFCLKLVIVHAHRAERRHRRVPATSLSIVETTAMRVKKCVGSLGSVPGCAIAQGVVHEPSIPLTILPPSQRCEGCVAALEVTSIASKTEYSQ
jgi:hypothetical protein